VLIMGADIINKMGMFDRYQGVQEVEVEAESLGEEPALQYEKSMLESIDVARRWADWIAQTKNEVSIAMLEKMEQELEDVKRHCHETRVALERELKLKNERKQYVEELIKRGPEISMDAAAFAEFQRYINVYEEGTLSCVLEMPSMADLRIIVQGAEGVYLIKGQIFKGADEDSYMCQFYFTSTNL